MSDCISRQAAIDAVEKSMYENPHENAIIRGMHDHEHRHFLTILMGLPSVQPERKKGEWIQKPRYEDDKYPDVQPNLKCPFCGYEIGWWDMGNYCARCGADLKGGAV